MGRYQRRSQQKPHTKKERLKYCVYLLVAGFYWIWSSGRSSDVLLKELADQQHDEEAEYHSIRKAVQQDYGQPESEMKDFVDHQRIDSQAKSVELLLSAEGAQISAFAVELLPEWVVAYFAWHRMQPIDSHKLVVQNLNYLDVGVYAAAQMNRLLVLDVPETKMVGTSPAFDWTMREAKAESFTHAKVLHAWDERETEEVIVLGSTEFLQSAALTTDETILSPSLFGSLWHSMFQPSRALLQSMRTTLDENALSPGRFATVICQVQGTEEATIDENVLFQKGKRAIQCGQWALDQAHQDFSDIYFISNSHLLNSQVLDNSSNMLDTPTGLERIVVAGKKTRRNDFSGIDHDAWWIDLYVSLLSRCNVYDYGEFGEMSSKISNADCQIRHEETEFGIAPLCPLPK